MDITQLSTHYSSTGQITLNDLKIIKELGFKTIICFRPQTEDKDNQINQDDLKNEALKHNLPLFLVIAKAVVVQKESSSPMSKVNISNKANIYLNRPFL